MELTPISTLPEQTKIICLTAARNRYEMLGG